MKKMLYLMLFVTSTSRAVIISPDGSATYVNPISGGYSTTNATTGEYTTYMQSGNMTTVIPDNGMGTPQTYITTDGEKPLILDSVVGEE